MTSFAIFQNVPVLIQMIYQPILLAPSPKPLGLYAQKVRPGLKLDLV